MMLFVGNLNKDTTPLDLETLFSSFGNVTSVEMLADHMTGRSRGCAYVQMEENVSAIKARDRLNNTSFMEKSIVVTDIGPGKKTAEARDDRRTF